MFPSCHTLLSSDTGDPFTTCVIDPLYQAGMGIHGSVSAGCHTLTAASFSGELPLTQGVHLAQKCLEVILPMGAARSQWLAGMGYKSPFPLPQVGMSLWYCVFSDTIPDIKRVVFPDTNQLSKTCWVSNNSLQSYHSLPGVCYCQSHKLKGSVP